MLRSENSSYYNTATPVYYPILTTQSHRPRFYAIRPEFAAAFSVEEGSGGARKYMLLSKA
jgi:hypothetical protein